MKKNLLLILVGTCLHHFIFSQNVAINSTGNNPDASAMLDIQSNSKGVLIPKMTNAERNGITSPATGLLIFQTDGVPGFYFNAGTPATPSWISLLSSLAGWKTSGNNGTNPSTNFIGTADNQPLVFRVNNFLSGRIDPASWNSFFGYGSGEANTIGFFNSFFGGASGKLNINGTDNSFFGYGAGMNNTSGSFNSFFGRSAGGSNSTGISNSFLGTSAGALNTTGQGNSFVGTYAGLNNTTGNFNSIFGQLAGYNNSSGNANSFFGNNSGYSNTTGGSNSFFGKEVGFNNSTGQFNTAIGVQSFRTNISGTENTLLGYSSEVRFSDLVNATAIGSKSTVACSNCLVLGSVNGINAATSSVKVGIGTTTPVAGLDLHHNNETGNPTLRLFDNSAGGSPTIQFQNAGGTENWQMTAFVNNSNIPQSELVIQNSQGQHMNIRGDGKIGIGKVPTEKLDVNGTIKATNVNANATVKANSFSFNTPKEYVYVLGGPDFTARLSSETVSTDLGFGGARLTTGSSGITAPVRLPKGAHITGFQVYFSDNSTQTLTIRLNRYNIIGGAFDFMATIFSHNTVQGFASNFTDIIIYPDMDEDYFYVVDANTDSFPWSSSMSVRGVKIYYTIPEL